MSQLIQISALRNCYRPTMCFRTEDDSMQLFFTGYSLWLEVIVALNTVDTSMPLCCVMITTSSGMGRLCHSSSQQALRI